MAVQPAAQQQQTSAPSRPAVETATKTTDNSAGSKNTAVETAVKAIPKQDTYTKSENSTKVSYERPKPLSSDALKEITDQRTQSFQNMLRDMMGTQGNLQKAASSNIASDLLSKLSGSGLATNQADAAAAIAEDGPWGINAVATRIMDMAVSLSGGDTSKIAVLKDAVEKGFKAAGVEFGQALPSICQKTHTEVMKRFDYWEKNGSLDGYVYGGDKQYAKE